jgi:hypothetical protein
LHLLAPIPWANRVWALPFLTALAPSERCAQQRRQRYKPLTLSRATTHPSRASLATRPAAGRRRRPYLRCLAVPRCRPFGRNGCDSFAVRCPSV